METRTASLMFLTQAMSYRALQTTSLSTIGKCEDMPDSGITIEMSHMFRESLVTPTLLGKKSMNTKNRLHMTKPPPTRGFIVLSALCI